MTRAVSGLLVALSLAASPLNAQARIKYEEYTLPNGLRVILVANHNAPLVTVDVWYRVGSRDEVSGTTGYAHLFEHLMYRGSEHVPDGRHYQLIDATGAETNSNAT